MPNWYRCLGWGSALSWRILPATLTFFASFPTLLFWAGLWFVCTRPCRVRVCLIRCEVKSHSGAGKCERPSKKKLSASHARHWSKWRRKWICKFSRSLNCPPFFFFPPYVPHTGVYTRILFALTWPKSPQSSQQIRPGVPDLFPDDEVPIIKEVACLWVCNFAQLAIWATGCEVVQNDFSMTAKTAAKTASM